MCVQKCPDPRYTHSFMIYSFVATPAATDAGTVAPELVHTVYTVMTRQPPYCIYIHTTVHAKHKWHMYIIGVGAWGAGGQGLSRFHKGGHRWYLVSIDFKTCLTFVIFDSAIKYMLKSTY